MNQCDGFMYLYIDVAQEVDESFERQRKREKEQKLLLRLLLMNPVKKLPARIKLADKHTTRLRNKRIKDSIAIVLTVGLLCAPR